MAKSINEIVKKYKFHFQKKIGNTSIYAKKRIQSKRINHSKLILDPLKVSSLPFPVKWNEIFDYENLLIEIGCGHGELLQHISSKDKDDLHLGFEVTKTYTLKTNKKVKNLDNSFVFKGDGYSNALNLTTQDSINKIYVLFPDPWHKKRHHKRRPLVEDWFRSIESHLVSNGEIFFATDWMEYYGFVLEEFNKVLDLYEIETSVYVPDDHGLIPTHYYLKWKEMGREFKYIRAIKKS